MKKSDLHCGSYAAACRLGIVPCDCGRPRACAILVPQGPACEVMPSYTQRSNNMKKVFRILIVTLLLAVWGSTPVLATGPLPVPLCWPRPCAAK